MKNAHQTLEERVLVIETEIPHLTKALEENTGMLKETGNILSQMKQAFIDSSTATNQYMSRLENSHTLLGGKISNLEQKFEDDKKSRIEAYKKLEIDTSESIKKVDTRLVKVENFAGFWNNVWRIFISMPTILTAIAFLVYLITRPEIMKALTGI